MFPGRPSPCIVHLVRHSLNFIRRENSAPRCFLILLIWKDRKAVAAKLREVYSAETAEAARDALEAFDAEWGRQYPTGRPGLAPGLGGGDPVLGEIDPLDRFLFPRTRLQPRDPPHDLHHECH